MDADQSVIQRKVGIELTNRCNLACSHCLSSCGANGQDFPQERLFRVMGELKAYGAEIVAFTGGEPFLRFETLKACVAEAARLGLKSTVITNGYWARSLEQATEMLAGVKELAVLCISSDPWHQEFIPPEQARIGTRAAKANGIRTVVRTVYAGDQQKQVEEAYQALFPEAEIESQPLLNAGRAERLDLRNPTDHTARCGAAYFPVITPAGDVLGCCGPAHGLPDNQPLRLGDINQEPADRILQRSRRNPLYVMLQVSGPFGLWQLIADQPAFVLRNYDTSSDCSFCRSLLADAAAVRALEAAAADPARHHSIGVEQLFINGEPDLLAEEDKLKEV